MEYNIMSDVYADLLFPHLIVSLMPIRILGEVNYKGRQKFRTIQLLLNNNRWRSCCIIPLMEEIYVTRK